MPLTPAGRETAPCGRIQGVMSARAGAAALEMELRRTEQRENVIAPGIRQRIEEHLRRRGVRGDDLEELTSEAMVRLVQSASQPGATPLANPGQYALAVASNLFADYVRRARPRWSHLKRCVLSVLEHPQGARLFARWRTGAEWVCGLRWWEGRRFHPTPRYLALQEDPADFRASLQGGRHPEEMPLGELMAALLAWIGTPLEMDDLVTLLARLRGIEEAVAVPLDAAGARGVESPEDAHQGVLDAMAAEEQRAQVWEQIQRLLPSHRAALLLSMSREELILAAGTLSSAARALGVDLEEFAGVWRVLPL